MAETVSRSRRFEPREVRRQQLMDATIQSIARYGLSGTTMTTVTGIARLSMGIVSFHFQNKDNLLVETLAHLAEEHRVIWRAAVADAGLSPERKLWAFVEAHFHPQVCTREKLSVWFAFFGDARYRQLYRERIKSIDEERWEETRRLCARIGGEGGYDDVDPAEIAKSLEGLYDGLWINIMMYPESFTADSAKRHVRRYLGAIFPRHFGPEFDRNAGG